MSDRKGPDFVLTQGNGVARAQLSHRHLEGDPFNSKMDRLPENLLRPRGTIQMKGILPALKAHGPQ